MRTGRLVKVFDWEPDLLDGLDEAVAARARRHVTAELIELPGGDLQPGALRLERDDLGLLVLEGHVLRRVHLFGRTGIELLGPGDVLAERAAHDGTYVPVETRLKVCGGARCALLDRDFGMVAAQLPGVLPALIERMCDRTISATVQLALAQLPQLDLRLLCLLWRLADRWGRVEPRGIRIGVRLSQESLAALTAARRPSVSTALKRLEQSGELVREKPGWILCGQAPDPTAAAAEKSAPLPAIRR